MKQSLSSYEFSFEYQGKFQYLDIFPFVSSLGGLCKALKEVGHTLHPEFDILIAIKETRKGSFWVNLAFLGAIAASTNLFQEQFLDYAKESLQFFVNILQLHKFLKGEPPREVVPLDQEKLKVINHEGNHTVIQQTVYNIYNSKVEIRHEIQKSFNALHQSPDIEAFSLTEGDKPLFRATRDDFPYLAKTTIEETEKDRKIHTVTTVHIIKPSFERGYKWFVVYEANKVHAEMLDEKFMEKIEKGKVRFGKGDALEVEMEIYQIYDPTLNTFVNKDFKILRVLRVIPAFQQRNLFFHLQD